MGEKQDRKKPQTPRAFSREQKVGGAKQEQALISSADEKKAARGLARSRKEGLINRKTPGVKHDPWEECRRKRGSAVLKGSGGDDRGGHSRLF